jgi:hypothetical protein
MNEAKVYGMPLVQSYWYECLVEGDFESGNNWEGLHSKKILQESFKVKSRKKELTSREVFMKEHKKIVDFN